MAIMVSEGCMVFLSCEFVLLNPPRWRQPNCDLFCTGKAEPKTCNAQGCSSSMAMRRLWSFCQKASQAQDGEHQGIKDKTCRPVCSHILMQSVCQNSFSAILLGAWPDHLQKGVLSCFCTCFLRLFLPIRFMCEGFLLLSKKGYSCIALLDVLAGRFCHLSIH